MKPDWKDAPVWAKYFAQDKDGKWYWYEEKPSLRCTYWELNKGNIESVNFKVETWKESLEKRP